MTQLEKFHDTVGILVKAYLNGELAHRSCTACAVGNLVAAKMGTRPLRDARNHKTGFNNNYYENGVSQTWFSYSNYGPQKSDQSEMTGYSIAQLTIIEKAFEDTPSPDTGYLDYQNDEWMFNGLMDVVDVLAEIHGVDLEVKQSAKEMFVK